MRHNNFIPRMAGFLTSCLLSIVVVCATWNCGVSFEHRIQIAVLGITVFWGGLLFKAKGRKEYRNVQILLSILIIIGIGAFAARTVWHSGYLSTTPLINIDSMVQRDTLYHCAIANGIKNYGYPSLLVNSDAFHNYHFGSHLILGLISQAIGVPVYFAYCYMYPVIFIPLYFYLIFSVSGRIRQYIGKNTILTVTDLIVCAGFIMFLFVPRTIAYSLADRKIPWFVSESFLVAATCFLLFFEAFFALYNSKKMMNKWVLSIGTIVGIPFFIILISLDKISFGLIFTCSIVYILFRRYGLKIKYLLLEFYYLVIFFCVYYLPNKIYSSIISATEQNILDSLQLFPYLRGCMSEIELWGWSLLIFYLYSLVFIAYRLRHEKTFPDLLSSIKSRKYLVEETLFLICFFLVLIESFVYIGGGSVFYFIAIQQLLATVLLIGYNVPNEMLGKIPRLQGLVPKMALVIVMLCVCCNFGVETIQAARLLLNDCTLNDEQYAESISEDTTWSVIQQIYELTTGSESDYYIYVDGSANIWSRYTNQDAAMCFYPAMTGIVCIGEYYVEDGALYTNDGTLKEDGYSIITTDEDTQMTWDDAYNKAVEDGKKAIIYIYDDTMSVKYVE